MATPSILINQATLGAGSTGVSRRDGVINQVVTCTDTVNGAGTYLWTVHGPNGVAVPLTGDTTATMTFTPTEAGVYLVFLIFNGADASYTLDADNYFVSSQGGLSIAHANGLHDIGGGESLQFSAVDGYALAFQELINKVAVLAASQRFTGNQSTEVSTLTYAATIALNAALNNAFKVTLTGAAILGNPTNAVENMAWTVRVTQDATGSRALTFDSNYVIPTAIDTSGDAANSERLLTCYALSATKIVVLDSFGAAV